MARRLAPDRLLVVSCDPVPSILQSVKEGQDGTRNEKLAYVLRQMNLQRLLWSARAVNSTYHCCLPTIIYNYLATSINPTNKVIFHYLRPAQIISALGLGVDGIPMDFLLLQ